MHDMSWFRLILRSLAYHWRAHVGVFLGATLGSAILIGALVVGDSVRGSLRDLGMERLLGHHFAMSSGDRFYRSILFSSFEPQHTLAGHLATRPDLDPSRYELTAAPATLLHLPGTAARQDQSQRANRVNVYGVPTGSLFRFPGSAGGGREAELDPAAEMAWQMRVDPPPGTVILNEALAAQLQAKPGDELVFRLHKPSALSRDAVITPREDQSIALRVRLHSVLTGAEGGNLSLRSSQTPPLNAFFRLEELDQLAGVAGLANLTLMPPFATRAEASFWQRVRLWVSTLVARGAGIGPEANRTLAPAAIQGALLAGALSNLWTLADAELTLRDVPGDSSSRELISRRIFLSDSLSRAALEGGGQGVLTYLVNELRHGDLAAPYSMVAAVEAPWVPENLADDEVVVNQWLAEDLQLKPGDALELSYYLLDTGTALVERTNRFRVRSIVSMQGRYADRSLMPEFPGLSKAESTRDWDAGFKLVHPIRDKDEDYWKQHRGTPKAFIRLSAGQKLWANRFGSLTAIRYPVSSGSAPLAAAQEALEASLHARISPETIGLRFEPVREQALQAAADSQDFGGLFIGFSFFLIVAALILMALLFQFGVEQRQQEIGTYLALGFAPNQVRRIYLAEGLALSGLAGLAGAWGGKVYAEALLWALGSLWQGAVGTSYLKLHLTPQTLCVGWVASLLVSGLTLFWMLRKLGRRPARELLSAGGWLEEASGRVGSGRGWSPWVMSFGLIGAVGMVGWALSRREAANAPLFFGASALALVAGLGAVSWCLRRWSETPALAEGLSMRSLLVRGVGRRRSRSLATCALLACGSFLVVSIGAHRLDAQFDAGRRSSGTGGFALIAESTLPVVQDLNTSAGREALNLDERTLSSVAAVPFRLRAGDDASCLNLNRAQNPRILGVTPAGLADRGAFSFAGTASGLRAEDGWKLLESPAVPYADGDGEGEVIPAIGDAASIQWALGKKLGDTLTLADETGRPFKIRLVAGLANSILQGNLVIHEREFIRRFPSVGGYQYFLIDAPINQISSVAAELSRGLKDVGLEATPTVVRLAQFNGVQNTYLNTFQMLGGLGLLLGSVGLGVVLLRNALERRAELGLFRALGFRRGMIYGLLFWEHLGLLTAGLGVGVGAALLAVVPVALSPTNDLPVLLLLVLVSGVFVVGLISTLLSSGVALRGRLLDNLRAE
jgi:putative ABC transport system permease protein